MIEPQRAASEKGIMEEPAFADGSRAGYFSAGSGLDYILGAVLALLTLFVIVGPQMGDTIYYVDSVREFQSGHWATRFNPLGEFGHLLWRPICAALAPVFVALVPDAIASTTPLKMAYGLIFLNEVAAVVSAALIFRISHLLSRSALAAGLITIGLLWGYGFLSYTKAGTDYVFGTGVVICALWVIIEFRGTLRLLIAGALLGFAALCWTPFALVVPAAAAVPWAIQKQPARTAIRDWLIVALASGALYLLVLSFGAWLSGVRSVADLRLWIREAGHGLGQNRTAMRAVSGWSRLFFDLGRGGVLLKRYVFHDPYNPVTLGELVRVVLWRIGFFYAMMAALFLAATRTEAGRKMLAVLAIATVPMLFFAIVLFEPSAPERFLPMLPFVLLAFAVAWASPKWPTWVATALLLSVVVANSAAVPSLSSDQNRLVKDQLQDFLASAAVGDALISVTQRDPLTQFLADRLFDPMHRGVDFPTFSLQPSLGPWKEDFSNFVLGIWSRGRDVWITKWALENQPPDIVGWAEGDDPAVRWRDIPAFFREFEYDRSTGRQDGFERLARSASNRAILENAVARSANKNRKPAK